MTDIQIIPYIPLTPDRLKHCSDAMVQANLLLKRYHKLTRLEACKIHNPDNGQFTYPRSQFRKELIIAAKTNLIVHGIKIQKKDWEVINHAKQYEWEMLCSIGGMIKKYSKRSFKNRGDDCSLDFCDFYNTAIIAALSAFWCYTQINIKFSTYAKKVIENKLIHFVGEYKSMSHWKDSARKLYVKYTMAVRKANGPITFDEIVTQLQLNNEQITELRMILCKVIGATAAMADNDEDSFDYSCLSIVQDEPKIEPDEGNLIDKANLSDWERKCLLAYVNSPDKNGWRTEVAKNTTNPYTGKRYSRMAPGIALQRALGKIRAVA